MTLTTAAAKVLLAEDNDNDVELTRIGFDMAGLPVQLYHVADGEECLAFLRREGLHADAPLPDLVLLDLNMPRMDGRQVLQALKNDARLRRLPIVVLTSSEADADVLAAYDLGCNAYVVKPLAFEQFARVVRTLAEHWFATVALPTRRPPKP